MSLTYGCVCSGYSAPTLAWKDLGWQTKFFAEIEKFPSAVLAHRYGSNMPGEAPAENGVPNFGDFTAIPESAGPIDLLVGGTPCQGFSIAGKRLGLDDPRGNLALEFLSLARRLGARWIVWENVPGVLSSFSGGPESLLEEGEEWEGDQDHDLATFLSFVLQCGYGFAYRVLDTQHVRTQRMPRAIPQRRRRVILVGYLGDWRRAAAVLFDSESLRGDPPPCRKAGQGAAGTISARTEGGGGLGTDFELGGGLVDVAPTLMGTGCGVERVGEGRGQDPVVAVRTVSATVSSKWAKGSGGPAGDECQNLVAFGTAPPLTTNQHADNEGREGLLVAHTLRAEGFDASEDGTGRGTPIVPVPSIAFDSKASGRNGFGVSKDVAPTLRAMGTGDAARPNGGGQVAIAIQERATSANSATGPDGVGVRTDGAAYTLEARTVPQAVAFAQNNRDEVRLVGGNGGIVGTLGADVGTKQQSYLAIASDYPESGEPFTIMERGRSDGSNLEYRQDGTANAILTPNGGRGGLGVGAIVQKWSVRRLTPRECSRLQGAPDDFCKIPWRGKPADKCPDGPQYRAYGNSMSTNVIGWVGERIDLMEKLIREGRI